MNWRFAFPFPKPYPRPFGRGGKMVKNEPTPFTGDDAVTEKRKPLQLGNILLTGTNVVSLLHRQNEDPAVPNFAGPSRLGDNL